MAFQLNFVDEWGEVFPASYWRAEYLELDVANLVGRVVFCGYADAARKGKRKIAVHEYYFTATVMQQNFTPAKLAIEEPWSSSYRLAKTLDVFFSAATNV